MKTLLLLCVLSFVGLSLTGTSVHPRGCVYVFGNCSRECEEGTHSYSTGCSYLKPEPTCDNPTPKVDTRGILCDFSACYCDSPTVRNTVTNKCVPLDECPK